MKIKFIITVILMLLICGSYSFGQNSWIENSYEDFVDGSFSDAGANMYVSHNGNMQAVNRWDVNNDGNADIIAFHRSITQVDVTTSNGSNFGGGYEGYAVWNSKTFYSVSNWTLLEQYGD